jgi:hypothetical protein
MRVWSCAEFPKGPFPAARIPGRPNLGKSRIKARPVPDRRISFESLWLGCQVANDCLKLIKRFDDRGDFHDILRQISQTAYLSQSSHYLQFQTSGFPQIDETTTMTTTRVHSIDGRLLFLFLFLLLALAVMMPTASAQSYSRDITYVSRGKNPQKDHGTFVLNGPSGRADYKLAGQPFVTARLRHYLEQESATSPGIRFLMYEEEGLKRLWAFQIDGASPGNFVIYVNESGEWWLPQAWKFYDLAHKYPERAEVFVYESAVIPAASPVYYSNAVAAHHCLGWFCHLWHW